MKKILAFKENEILKSYPFYSDYLGVLVAKKHNPNNIFYNNFFTLYYEPWKNQVGFRRFNSVQKMFEINSFSINYANAMEFVISQIDNDKYVEIVLNGRFFNIININEDYFHNWLIYGYDIENKKFLCRGYVPLNFNIHQNMEFQISFEEFKKSLPNNGQITRFEKNIMNNHVFSLPDNYSNPSINKKRIILDLIKYIIPVPPMFFNISIYDKFIKNIDKFNYLDLRNYVTLYEHKKIISLYIENILKNDDVLKKFNEKVLSKSYIMLLMAIKYNKRKNPSILEQIKENMIQIKVQERKILKKIILFTIKGKM